MSERTPGSLEEWLAERERARRRVWRSRLALSLALHAGVVLLLMIAPAPARTALPDVVNVNLLASAPAARPKPASRPKPAAKAPAPAPAPKPPPPPPEKVKVLPKEAPKAKPRAKAPNEPARPRPQARPSRREPLDYDDALAALRGELGEEEPEAEPAEDPGVTEDSASGSGVDPGLARWQGLARNHVSARWVDPPEFRNRGLQTELRITLLGDGTVIGPPVVVRSSGDAFADDNAVRAILQSAPLPSPPRAGEYTFIFRPEDTP